MDGTRATGPAGAGVIPHRKARLLDQVREVMRVRHYSLRTEQAYVAWVKRFIFFHLKRHPREMGSAEIEAFLTDLAVRQHVASSTQMQAFNALIFLWRQLEFTSEPGSIWPVSMGKRLMTKLGTSCESRTCSIGPRGSRCSAPNRRLSNANS
jgi:Phage integrase, N-terminal SAM-like domain